MLPARKAGNTDLQLEKKITSLNICYFHSRIQGHNYFFAFKVTMRRKGCVPTNTSLAFMQPTIIRALQLIVNLSQQYNIHTLIRKYWSHYLYTQTVKGIVEKVESSH